MTHVTAWELLRAGSLSGAFAAGPGGWLKMSGGFGYFAVVIALLAVTLAVLGLGRRTLLWCALAALVQSGLAAVGGARVAAANLNLRSPPLDIFLRPVGTESLAVVPLGLTVALFAVLLALVVGRRKRPAEPSVVQVEAVQVMRKETD